EDGWPGEDVRPEEEDGEVFGIDDLGAARHVEDVLGQRRAQGETPRVLRGAHPGAVGLADDGVVLDPAAVGVEGLALAQEDQVALPALVDEQDLLAVLEASEGGPVADVLTACAALARSRTRRSPEWA